jgi:hypothetical protein
MSLADSVPFDGLVTGLGVHGYLTSEVDCINSHPAAKEVHIITIDTGTDAATYTALLAGYTITHLATSATAATIAANWVNELRQDSRFFGKFTFVNSGATIVITRTEFNKSFTLSDSDAKITCTLSVAAASASTIGFAQPVFRTTSSLVAKGRTKITACTTLTKRVDTVTFVYASGGELSVTALFGTGKFKQARTLMATSESASRTAFLSAANTAFDGYLVFAAHASSDKFTITSNVHGLTYELAFSAATADMTSDANNNASYLFAGISKRATHQFSDENGGGYRPNTGFTAFNFGGVYVPCTVSNIKPGDPVFYDAANETYVNSPGSTYYYIPKAKFAFGDGTVAAIVLSY